MVGEAVKACGALHLALVTPGYSDEAIAAQYYYARAIPLLHLHSSNPTTQHTETCAVIATINLVFNIMSGKRMTEHISTARACIQRCGWNALSSGLAGACFWFNVGIDALHCAMCHSPVTWHPDRWKYDLPDRIILPQKGRLAPGAWMHSIIYIMAQSINARSAHNTGAAGLAQRRKLVLFQRCEWWKVFTPRAMQPLGKLDFGHQRWMANPG